MIMSYLSDWKGPVFEEEDPYGDGVSPDGLEAAVHVQEIRLLNGLSHDRIKQMIMEQGAVQSSLCLNRKRTDTDEYHYYNALTGAYFDPLTENVDHDILILGWDDNYSRENFRIKPPSDGAWICQNTWGESFGEEGIFYVSYEDRNLFRQGGAAYARIEDVDNYDHVYENDTLGWQGRQGYGLGGCWFAGAYTAESAEEVAAVGLYSTGPGTVCRVYVIPEFEGEQDLKAFGTDESEGEQSLKALGITDQEAGAPAAEAEMDTAGFFTIDLEERIPLEAGQRFAVVVWIDTEQESKPVAVEMTKDQYTVTVQLEGRQTWISPDGKKWDHTQTAYGTNVCLKVYTNRSGGIPASLGSGQ